MIKWIKKDGREIETNEQPASIEAALKLGWKKADSEQKDTKPKKPE